MNVLLIIGNRRVHPAYLETVVGQLDLPPGTTVDLLTWYPPSVPLAVRTHYMCWPDRRHPLGWLRPVPVQGSAGPAPTEAVAGSEPGSSDLPAPSAPSADEAAPAAVASASCPAGATTGAATADTAAVRDRVRAVAGRALRRAKQTARSTAATKLRPSGSTAFAAHVAADPVIPKLLALADVVVAVDSAGQSAAWVCARRHPRPVVVAGTAAGAKALARLQSAGERR